ncbi:MAG: hypothetical protein CME70_02285 [Halobacteriovorax sp.]|nr:hypothetical protein [Halobacteriovorax sp.]|tara:strand:+ start:63747 stop:64703 length:957 start_codon:yes stop_codon:yes gene_type:complete
MNKKGFLVIIIALVLGGLSYLLLNRAEENSINMIQSSPKKLESIDKEKTPTPFRTKKQKAKERKLRSTSPKKFKNIEAYINWFENDSPYGEIKFLKKRIPEIYDCEENSNDLYEKLKIENFEDEDFEPKRSHFISKAKEFQEKDRNCTMLAKGVLSALNSFFIDNDNEKAKYLIHKKYKVGEYFEHYQEMDRTHYRTKLILLYNIIDSEPTLSGKQLRDIKFIKMLIVEATLEFKYSNLARLRYLTEVLDYLVDYKVIHERFASEMENFNSRINELSLARLNSMKHEDLSKYLEDTELLAKELRLLFIKIKQDTYPSE